MEESYIWHNGEFKLHRDAVLSIYDIGMMYGYVFEMTRTFNKITFKLREHIERLYRSLRYLSMKIPYTIDEISDICNEVISKNIDIFNRDDEHRLIINVYGGVLDTYRELPSVHRGTHVMITDIPLRWTVRGVDELFDRGINMVTVHQKVIPSSVLSNQVKHHCRLHFLRANMEASNRVGSNNWPILSDNDGNLCEFPGANLFIVKNGNLYTPPLDNILDGISRRFIINELVPVLKLKCYETNITPYDVITADESFASATPFCILPVTSFNHDKIGDGCTGKITYSLLSEWSDIVGVDIVGQIKYWNHKYKEDVGTTPYTYRRK